MTQILIDEIPANCSPAGECWRLVHDGERVLALFTCRGETWTTQPLFCATTRAECQAEIERLHLIPLAEEP